MDTQVEDHVDSVLFPDISLFESDTEDLISDQTPITPWALTKIGTFQYRLEDLLQNREARRGKITLVSHISTSMILQLANEVFGFNGWSSSILECNAVEQEFDIDKDVFSMKHEALIRVILQDGTVSNALGVGKCSNVPHKYMCLENSKKMAITDGLRNAILNFTSMIFTHESAVKEEESW